MLNFLAKFLLSATSLMPLLLVIAVKTWEDTRCWTSGVPWVGTAVVLILLYWCIMTYVKRKAQRFRYKIDFLERKDQAVVSYLFIYLLPVIRLEDPTFLDHPVTSIVVISIILLAIARTDSFYFNPVMWVFRERCFATTRDGSPVLLITDVARPIGCVTIVRLARDVYLHVGADNE